jgi:hypothetical protein
LNEVETGLNKTLKSRCQNNLVRVYLVPTSFKHHTVGHTKSGGEKTRLELIISDHDAWHRKTQTKHVHQKHTAITLEHANIKKKRGYGEILYNLILAIYNLIR